MKKIDNILLLDQTTKTNIKWATNDYLELGDGYHATDEITTHKLVVAQKEVVSSRAHKDKDTKILRTHRKAEVYTPSWICNLQLNAIDDAWFGRKDIFNSTVANSWVTQKKHISFSNCTKTWMDYVSNIRLEISCGEAPYLVSRYDVVDNKIIPLSERIGILDRKIRIINENTNSEEEWIRWVQIAYESTYGFEYFGDSLLLARRNLLETFNEYFKNRYGKEVDEKIAIKIATIISWNIWQMDAYTCCPPNDSTLCVIRDWAAFRQKKRSIVPYKGMLG